MTPEQIKSLVRQEIQAYNTAQPFNVRNTSAHQHNGIDSSRFLYANLLLAPTTFAVAATTNGTTPVNVFSASGAPFPLTVTGVFLIAQDATASNITLKQAVNTVVTIAKGTTSGGMVGGVTLANTVYSTGDVCTVVSSGTGNATVIITYSI